MQTAYYDTWDIPCNRNNISSYIKYSPDGATKQNCIIIGTGSTIREIYVGEDNEIVENIINLQNENYAIKCITAFNTTEALDHIFICAKQKKQKGKSKTLLTLIKRGEKEKKFPIDLKGIPYFIKHITYKTKSIILVSNPFAIDHNRLNIYSYSYTNNSLTEILASGELYAFDFDNSSPISFDYFSFQTDLHAILVFGLQNGGIKFYHFEEEDIGDNETNNLFFGWLSIRHKFQINLDGPITYCGLFPNNKFIPGEVPIPTSFEEFKNFSEEEIKKIEGRVPRIEDINLVVCSGIGYGCIYRSILQKNFSQCTILPVIKDKATSITCGCVFNFSYINETDCEQIILGYYNGECIVLDYLKTQKFALNANFLFSFPIMHLFEIDIFGMGLSSLIALTTNSLSIMTPKREQFLSKLKDFFKAS